jgi:hypothetical protein
MSQEPTEDRFDDIAIFTTEDGATRVEVRFQKERVLAPLERILTKVNDE